MFFSFLVRVRPRTITLNPYKSHVRDIPLYREGDSKGTFGHPQTSFFETIDEPRVIVLVRITEVRIMEKRSMAEYIPPYLSAYHSVRGISLLPVAVTS